MNDNPHPRPTEPLTEDPTPKTEEDLFRDYDKDDIHRRLARWLTDPPVGKEPL